jgi:hypothetical protein
MRADLRPVVPDRPPRPAVKPQLGGSHPRPTGSSATASSTSSPRPRGNRPPTCRTSNNSANPSLVDPRLPAISSRSSSSSTVQCSTSSSRSNDRAMARHHGATGGHTDQPLPNARPAAHDVGPRDHSGPTVELHAQGVFSSTRRPPSAKLIAYTRATRSQQ